MEVPTHEPTGHAPDCQGTSRSPARELRCQLPGVGITYTAFVGPSVPQLPLDRFGNLYATVSGTGSGLLGVVDPENNYRLLNEYSVLGLSSLVGI